MKNIKRYSCRINSPITSQEHIVMYEDPEGRWVNEGDLDEERETYNEFLKAVGDLIKELKSKILFDKATETQMNYLIKLIDEKTS